MAVGLSFVCGLAYGALTFRVESLVDCPTWYEVWHGVLPWGIVTLAIGFAVRTPLGIAVAAGLATQIGLVAGYYSTQLAVYHEVARYQIAMYGAAAVTMGPLYGAAGAWLRDRAARHHPLVVALVSAPCLIDGIHQLSEAADPDYTVSQHLVEMTAAGVSYVVLSVVLLCWLSRSWRDGIRAAAITVAFGAVFVAMLWLNFAD